MTERTGLVCQYFSCLEIGLPYEVNLISFISS